MEEKADLEAVEEESVELTPEMEEELTNKKGED